MIQKKNRLMSVDPSINNLGVAVWEIHSILKQSKLVMYKLVHPERHCRENEFEKSWSMLTQLKQWKQTYGVNRVICEVPEQWAVAGFQARETGSMTKLMFVCGLLYSMRGEVEEYKLVTPREWKGQIPKRVMENRLREDYLKIGVDLAKIDDNVMDAIGIGHFYVHGSV